MEVLNLTLPDLDFHHMSLRIQGKGNKERVMPLANRWPMPWCSTCAWNVPRFPRPGSSWCSSPHATAADP